MKDIASTEYSNLTKANEYLKRTLTESNLNFNEIGSLIMDRYHTISKYATDTSESIRSNISTNNSEVIKE